MEGSILAIVIFWTVVALVVVVVALVLLYRLLMADRAQHAANIQTLIDGWADDRQYLVRALVADSAPELAMLTRTDDAPDFAHAQAATLGALDPRRGVPIEDPETGETIVMAGMTGGLHG